MKNWGAEDGLTVRRPRDMAPMNLGMNIVGRDMLDRRSVCFGGCRRQNDD